MEVWLDLLTGQGGVAGVDEASVTAPRTHPTVEGTDVAIAVSQLDGFIGLFG